MDTIGERIKFFRESAGLTAKDFGARIGMGNSSVSKIEKGVNGTTDQTIKSICREFRVREEWLRYGTGEMYEPDLPINNVDAIFAGKGISELEADVIKAYMELPPELREAFIKHFADYFAHKKAAGERPPGADVEVLPHDD